MSATSSDVRLVRRMLEVLEKDVVPLTREGVRDGNKIFGAAVLRKDDLALVVAGTNLETACPLWHGEVATIKKLYEMPAAARPRPAECYFLSTHEPCSMCLSAITWAGYDNIHYLFGYEQTRDAFHIPHDLKILREVFGCRDGGYARENAYWSSHDLVAMVEASPEEERGALRAQVAKLRDVYDALSAVYQAMKRETGIPLP